MTVIEIYQALKKQNKKLLNSDFTFMNDYNNSSEKLDLLFANLYASRDFFMDVDAEQTIALWEDLTNANIELNKYKYETLYNTTKFIYNPIENYNRKEEITDTRTPNLTTTNVETTSIGAQENSNNITYGSQTNSSTNVLGEKTDTTTNTIGNSTTTNKVSAFDSATLVDKDSSITTKENDVTSTNFGTQNNTTNETLGEKTDATTTNIGSRNDERNVISKTSGNEINKHVAEIKGNIGTMSTQNMVLQEREVALFTFYKIIFDDFIKLYTIGVW